MIKAILTLVPIFGFELHDAKQRSQHETRDESLARPRKLGFRMGCYRFIRDRG